MDLFAAHTALAVFAYTVVAIGVLASVVAIGVIAEFVVSNRRERLARHQSIGSYYRELATTH